MSRAGICKLTISSIGMGGMKLAALAKRPLDLHGGWARSVRGRVEMLQISPAFLQPARARDVQVYGNCERGSGTPVLRKSERAGLQSVNGL